ncbi:MAG TPA: DUF4936 family protein [Burkholderiaceae bacterium]|nr:DUF4936 family protein [Burkholderiaceae bacterium]
MRALFIYYRIPVERADEVRPALHAMQARLVRTHEGLQAELLRRPEPRDGHQTWMEIYRHPQGVDEALEAHIEHAAADTLRPWLIGPRHVEVFVPCAS